MHDFWPGCGYRLLAPDLISKAAKIGLRPDMTIGEALAEPIRFHGLAANKLDFVWFGGVTYCQAMERTGGKAVLVACREMLEMAEADEARCHPRYHRSGFHFFAAHRRVGARRENVHDAATHGKVPGVHHRARARETIRRQKGDELVRIHPVAGGRRKVLPLDQAARHHALQDGRGHGVGRVERADRKSVV